MYLDSVYRGIKHNGYAAEIELKIFRGYLLERVSDYQSFFTLKGSLKLVLHMK